MILASGCWSKRSARSASRRAICAVSSPGATTRARTVEPIASLTISMVLRAEGCAAPFGSRGLLGTRSASPITVAQRRGDLRSRQRASLRRRRRDRQDRNGITAGQIVECLNGCREELPQRRAQLVDLPSPRPDQRLMSTREHLHRFGHSTVTRHRPMQMPVGAGQISQHLGISRIRLRPRSRVPFPIPRRRHRIDRQHRVAGRDQRTNEQPAIRLGARSPPQPDHRRAQRASHGTVPPPRSHPAPGPPSTDHPTRPRRTHRDDPQPNHGQRTLASTSPPRGSRSLSSPRRPTAC